MAWSRKPCEAAPVAASSVAIGRCRTLSASGCVTCSSPWGSMSRARSSSASWKTRTRWSSARTRRRVVALRPGGADGMLRGYFEAEVAMETELSAITPIMLVLLWRRRLYGSWRYYAITN